MTDMEYVSAFTVAELGEMLPYRINRNARGDAYRLQLKKLDTQWSAAYFPPFPQIGFEEDAGTEADARAKMLVYLIEKGLYSPPEKTADQPN